MPHPAALVLTTNPAECLLNDAVAERVRVLLPQDATERWLAPGAAYEVVWQPPDARAIRATRAAVTAALASHPIDVNIVPARPDRRVKKLLAADMESTLIEQELIDELASRAGRRSEIAALTLQTMRGDIDFVTSLRQRVGCLAGLTAADIDAVAQAITVMPGARSLVTSMKAQGARTVLVSGGFTVFIERVAATLGFDDFVGNVLDIDDGRLTGAVHDPILDANGKRDILLDCAAADDLDLSETLAIGDGANDLAMIKEAGLGVAFRGKPVVRAEAPFAIDHGDLTTLLYFQGYKEIEIH